jgi:2,5-furandicarboxylate decarboxylase 1
MMLDIAGYPGMRLVGGLTATRNAIAMLLGCSERKLAQEFSEALQRRVPAQRVSDSPVKEVVLHDEDVDLTLLPISLLHRGDGGPYISSGVVVATDPLCQMGVNAGMYRLMYRTRNETGIDLVYASDLRTFYEQALRLGRPLPISVVIGVHPLVMMAATYKAPAGISELDIAGSLMNEPLAVVKSETSDIPIPAESEIVLEGEILPIGWTEQEGPFGEFGGYQGESKWNPIVRFHCLTMRRDPIYYSLGMPWENDWLLAPATEAAVMQAIQHAGVRVNEVRTTYGSACFWQVIASIDKRAGEGKNALLAALSVGGVKIAIVTDSDVDIFDQEALDRAMAFRVRPSEDVMIVTGCRGNHVDPTVEAWRLPKGFLPVTSKLGIDATRPESVPSERYQPIEYYRMDKVDLEKLLMPERRG